MDAGSAHPAPAAPAPVTVGGPGASTLPRRRDAAQTRRLLLRAALHRFALQGYAATTVREIADDVGVNAALISRYFDSKEGLFEECLTGVSTELGATAPATTLDEVALRMAEQLTGPSSAEHPNQLVLLLRSSGDERAEQIRFETLRTYAVRLADVAEAATGGGDGSARAQLVLRAQLAISAALGIALLRSRTDLEPLASVETTDLVAPLTAMIRALLEPRDGDA